MKELWDKYEKWLSANFESGFRDLNPPITDEELENLQSTLDVQLAQDFIDFLKVHNGQAGNAGGIIDATELLSSTRILDEWRCWKDLLDSGEFEGYDEERANGVKADWWNQKWIPFTYNGAGDHLCLDLDPSGTGSLGQVITMWHDDGEREVKSNSFKAWFSGYVDDVLQGKYVYCADYDGVVSVEDI
ncbi:SMI1/KNR4 family protein [Microbulbifer sp. CAU 1566]|uniref:SMI1/KNR4 family protein n=1 Tax=unclassified Microbulbifer TaxID=2619833 RepID=UPI00135C88BC|nr:MULTISPECIES: SMI1/KNR4 family protein [unclassified Microbulbifer]MCK7597758.1 SMI1/KNR4 family protein [Microbulbifer sp. CAU 1566]